MRFNVALPSVDSVNRFCAVASTLDNDVDVCYRHYILDGKSVLGIQSIPRNEQLSVFIHDVELYGDLASKLLEKFAEFIVKQ